MKLKILILSFLAVFLVAGNAMALELGTNITIWDGMGIDQEDNEVELGCVPGQVWDLEGFFLKGSTLTMVGGFDFEDGYSDNASGDIFIDVHGDAQYGPSNIGGGSGNAIVQNTFGYDYVLDMDFDKLTYSVYELMAGVTTVAVYYGQNDESNPWRYDDGGSLLSGASGSIDFYENKTGLDSLDGVSLWNGLGTHYAAAVDLGFLGADIDKFTAHFTMECGNDNLMGAAPVPEPATMLLLGTGLICFAGFGRKRLFKRG